MVRPKQKKKNNYKERENTKRERRCWSLLNWETKRWETDIGRRGEREKDNYGQRRKETETEREKRKNDRKREFLKDRIMEERNNEWKKWTTKERIKEIVKRIKKLVN